jgi:hypothetical protein
MFQTIISIIIVLGALGGLLFFAFARKGSTINSSSCGCIHGDKLKDGSLGCGCNAE